MSMKPTTRFLPSTPNRTVSPGKHCSLSHGDYLTLQYFKSEQPILDTGKAYNYGNYYSDMYPKTIITMFYILDCRNNFPLKINPWFLVLKNLDDSHSSYY